MNFKKIIFILIIAFFCIVSSSGTAFSWVIVSVSSSPSTIPANDATGSTISASVWNTEEGAPGSGVGVQFSTTLGTLSSSYDITNSSGTASVTLTSSSSGIATVTASISTDSGSTTVTCFGVEILQPTESQDFDYTAASNYLAHNDISFRALIQPTSISGTINWQLKLTDPESGEINNRDFTSDSGGIYNFSYSNWGESWGGNLLVTASTTINSNILQAVPVNGTITGIVIAYSTISAAMGNDLFRAVCWRESTYRQFDSQGWPLRSGNDRGLMQINAQWGNIREYSWNWQSNINKGTSLLNANYNQSVNHANNLGHSMTNYQHWNNALSLYNTGGYYYVWDDATSQWVSNPNNQTGVAYANSVRNYETTKPWQ